MEIIQRFEKGQIAAADGLREFEDLTGGINAEQGAHAELGMDERAFSILRIIETSAPDMDHATLQAAAVATGVIYANTQRSQPSWFFMDSYKKELRRQVRRILGEYGIPEAKAIRDEIEGFAVHAYAGPH
jgi:type I restriction enzyme, R subunit